jgi:adenylate kinase
MKLLITGTPGCGKTTLAKSFGKKLGLKVINEKDFALANSIGGFNEENELELPLNILEKKINLFLKNNDNVVFEGHVLCETKLDVDLVIIITINPEILEMRLEKRNYSSQKIMDNVFCEGINYCEKQVRKNYSKKKIIKLVSSNSPLTTFTKAFDEVKLRI